MVQICVFFCTIALPLIVEAQFNNMWDSIRISMQSKPEFTGGMDGKNTFVSGRGVPITGFEIGISFKKKISYKVGVYFLKNPIYSSSTLNRGTVNEATYQTKAHLFYVSLTAEYNIIRNKKWVISMPVKIGVGKAYKDYLMGKELMLSKESTIFPIELAFTGNYRIWRFIGLSGGLGYRNALGLNIIKDEDFSGITYSLGIKIWFRDLCKFISPDCQYCRYL